MSTRQFVDAVISQRYSRRMNGDGSKPASPQSVIQPQSQSAAERLKAMGFAVLNTPGRSVVIIGEVAHQMAMAAKARNNGD